MAGETVITVVGNLVEDPELRFTPSGAAVAAFRIASTPSRFNKDTSKWEDGDSLFLRCSVWRQAAENVAESLQRGMRVVVQGRLKQREWETKEGEKRTSYEIDVDEVGPSLKFATAKVVKTQRGGGGGGFGAGQQADNDPWASAGPASGGQGNQGNQGGGQGNQGGGQGNQGGSAGGWGASGSAASDEPPF